MTLISLIGNTMTRSTTSTIGPIKIQYQLRFIILFPLLILTRLKKALRFNIIDEPIQDKVVVTSLETNTNT